MATTERQETSNDAALETSGAAKHTASYIEDMVAEMEQLAAGEGLDALRFLLGRAKEEARRAAE